MIPEMENKQRSARTNRMTKSKQAQTTPEIRPTLPRRSMLASCWYRGYSISYELPTNQFERAMSSRGCTCHALKCVMRCAMLPGTSCQHSAGFTMGDKKYQSSTRIIGNRVLSKCRTIGDLESATSISNCARYSSQTLSGFLCLRIKSQTRRVTEVVAHSLFISHFHGNDR